MENGLSIAVLDFCLKLLFNYLIINCETVLMEIELEVDKTD